MSHLGSSREMEGPDLIYFSIRSLWLEWVTDFHTGCFIANKHTLSNSFWPWPPGVEFSLHKDVARRQLHKTKPYAMQSRHLPRETSALLNMTLENKELFLMCLKLHITWSYGRKCGLFALLMSRKSAVFTTKLLTWHITQQNNQQATWTFNIKVLDSFN